MEIILEKNKNVKSINKEKKLEFGLSSKYKLLPSESISDTFSLLEQYNKERDYCKNYRFIFNINPVCSNVLFNLKTEVVIYEGKDACKCLNFENNGWSKNTYARNAVNSISSITITDAIRNTEYSNPMFGGFDYKCGIDIFNNHLLRKKIFMHINKADYSDFQTSAYTMLSVYNTISDYLRDNNGNVIKEKLNVECNNDTEIYRHIYNTDSLYNLRNAFYNRCAEKDGWWGFNNPGMINIPTTSSNTISNNVMLSDKKPCEFVDFYPDRSLFSFIPKFNYNRNRAEYNWDYCLTYPYSKDVDIINTICGSENGAIKAMFKTVMSRNSQKLLQCSSYFKHNLIQGDIIHVFYYVQNDENQVFPSGNEILPHNTNQLIGRNNGSSNIKKNFVLLKKDISVYSIGDSNGNNSDRIFSIKFDDIKFIYDNLKNFGLFYKKVSNGVECGYYVRKFKKIRNVDESDLRSDLNKVAFGTNIYGDDIAQIVYIDDLVTEGIVDENGREVSEVYLTFIKTNRGNEKWYKDNDFGSSEVEYSHCFGKLTSGIDFSGVDVNEEPFDYNVRYLHNLDIEANVADELEINNTFSAWGQTILRGMPKFIESGITADSEEFYGDVVEFDNYNYKTTEIGNICHRFNTMQRELFDIRFRDIIQDLIVSDDYDAANNINSASKFTVKSYYVNDLYSSLREVSNPSNSGRTLIYGNIAPEGYFYNPHNKIQIKSEDEVNHSSAVYLNYDEFNVEGIYIVGVENYGGDEPLDRGGNTGVLLNEPVQIINGYYVTIKVPTDYGFIKGDFICFYDKITKDSYWGTIESFNNFTLKIRFGLNSFGGINVLDNKNYFNPSSLSRRFFAFWSEYDVPSYAKLCIETGLFSWRKLLNQSELSKSDELYDLPFSNGRLYVEKNINFYLKRQDPNGDYGLSVPINFDINNAIPNPTTKFIINGNEHVDLSIYNNVINDKLETCY